MNKIVECEEENTGINYEYDKILKQFVCTVHFKNNCFNDVVLKSYNYKKSRFEYPPIILKKREIKIIKLSRDQILSIKDDKTNRCLFIYIKANKEINTIIEAQREFAFNKMSAVKIFLIDSVNIAKENRLSPNNGLYSFISNSKMENKKREWLNKDSNIIKNTFLIEKNSSKLPLYNNQNSLRLRSTAEIMIEKLGLDQNENIPNICSENSINIGPYIYYKNYKLGYGSFGEVYYGTNRDSTDEYAIKIQEKGIDDDKVDTLCREVSYLETLENIEGFPKKIYFDQGFNMDDPDILVESLLGPSLDKLLKFNGKFFSLQTICQIGLEMIRRIRDLHNHKIIHRDIKPNNFVWGTFSNLSPYLDLNKIFLIDLGLSINYCDEFNEHFEYTTGNNFIGTLRYASVNAHLGIRMSRRDDIESIIYVLIFLFKGYLPWQGVKAKTKSERMNAIKNIKNSTSIDELTKDLPQLFNDILQKTKLLKYKEMPNYDYYIYKFACYATDYIKYKYEWVNEIMNPENKLKLKELFHGYPFFYDRYIECVKKYFD